MSNTLSIRRSVVPTWFLWVTLATVMVGLLIYAGYRWPSYSGFGETDIIRTKTVTTHPSNDKEITETRQTQSARTVWDWIGLVGVGSAIALAGWIIARKQQEREQIATLEHTQDEALAAYLDQMSNLLVDQGLSKEHKNPTESTSRGVITHAWKIPILRKASAFFGSDGVQEETQPNTSVHREIEDHLRRVAQARTTAILLSLDAAHKRRPLKLIYELGLINRGTSVLELYNAGLDHASLSELSMRKANLRRADFRSTDLSGSDLSGADLSLADMRGTDLRRVNLRHTNLRGVNFLPYDERDPERWNLHNLRKLDLDNEQFSPRKIRFGNRRLIITRRDGRLTMSELAITNLGEATLVGAQLRNARLCGADLRDADLRNAKLRGADLRGATLKGADLRGARHLTQEQIERAKGDQRTRLPDHLKRPKTWALIDIPSLRRKSAD
jgi:uncharacterized protein YjbI with pentapeptide repeats/type II secretory pathway pseudopilin PulG